ncbi:MAG: hypothetical protein N2689_05445 [Verrucomicrobiae bacterium]|nr:hypothetical protein [Verrucomicrobiae bacterium]
MESRAEGRGENPGSHCRVLRKTRRAADRRRDSCEACRAAATAAGRAGQGSRGCAGRAVCAAVCARGRRGHSQRHRHRPRGTHFRRGHQELRPPDRRTARNDDLGAGAG